MMRNHLIFQVPFPFWETARAASKGMITEAVEGIVAGISKAAPFNYRRAYWS
jgi:hypothetical protein